MLEHTSLKQTAICPILAFQVDFVVLYCFDYCSRFLVVFCLRVSNWLLFVGCEYISPVSTDSETVLDSLRQASDELLALEVTYAIKNATQLLINKLHRTLITN